MRAGVRGVGYEGRDIGEFVDALVSSGVTVLADVRAMPLSRKRGFSKRSLAEALEVAGITYLHLRALGNPKPNRSGFSGDDDERSVARERYRSLLGSDDARDAIAALADLATRESVALMCFEADQHRCHRDIVLEELTHHHRVG